MKYRLIAFFFVLAHSLMASEASKAALFDESRFWPDRIQITEPIAVANKEKPLSVGHSAVLIRIEDHPEKGSLVLADFGEEGVIPLLPSQTDVLERVKDLKSGKSTKKFPNMTMMIGRGFMRVSDVVEVTKLSELVRYKYMLFVYDSQFESEAFQSLFQAIVASEEALEAQSILVVFMPQELSEPMQHAEILNLTKESGLTAYYMYPYLSVPFTASLRHDVGQYPAVVLADVEGKLIDKHMPSTPESVDWDATISDFVKTVK